MLVEADYKIDHITMTCIINHTIRTISLTTDNLNTALLLATFFLTITLAVNQYLNISDNPITEFQLVPTTVDIGLDIVPLIALPDNSKDLLQVIKDQVYFTCKIEVVQARYMVLNWLKRLWKEDNSSKKFSTIIISVPATDAFYLNSTIKLFSRNVRVSRIVPCNLAT